MTIITFDCSEVLIKYSIPTCRNSRTPMLDEDQHLILAMLIGGMPKDVQAAFRV